MHSGNNGEGADRVRRLLTRASFRAALPYLAIGILVVIAVVLVGREIDHHINAIESWIAQLGPWGVLAFVALFVLATSFLAPDTVLCIIAGAAQALGIENLRVEHAHSAHWKPVRSFDMIVSRATARLPSYLEQAAPLASPGGRIIAYKTANLESNEAAPANVLLENLRLSAEPPYLYDLELEGETLRRALYIYRKNA
ncbi:MAG TPA: RsmG family class I SAM-dependent methyltransferase [Acidobacteriota bacterium]|nr:RsmG family class I SAM-dependent methyltransferase [Acidobacteriota bacterium]